MINTEKDGSYRIPVGRPIDDFIRACIDTDERDKAKNHNHYFRDVSHLNRVDIYRILELFNVDDPCMQHVVKKAIACGKRGHKNIERDVQDMIDTLTRWQEMRIEDATKEKESQ